MISFDAYGRVNGESLYNQSIFEYSDGGEATVQFPCDGWVKLSFVLKKDCSYVDLFWNYDRAGITSDKASGEATEQFKCDGWTELKMELPEDAEYIDLFWNYDRTGITSSTASGEVYLDNFLVVEPA